MTTPILKIKVLAKPVIKGKMDVRFPARVQVVSPILLDNTGGVFTFSMDINALVETLNQFFDQTLIFFTKTVTAAGTYNVVASDNVVLINKTVPAANSVQLPNAVSRSGLPVTVKDLKGDAATNNITVLPSGSETIDGLASLRINSNYGGYQLLPVQKGPTTYGWTILP